MCTTCGCASGEVKIDGVAEDHSHEHTHADGSVHNHPHDHAGEHAHPHPHAGVPGSEHPHAHVHADGSIHQHSHDHAVAAHAHAHKHAATPDAHAHDHVHADGTTHNHDHVHLGDHQHTHTSGQDLHYGLGPAHSHAPGLSQSRMVKIEQDILAKNDSYAATNRQRFADEGVFAINLVSSPGSGKTTLLVKTIEAIKASVPVVVIEGDQQTSQDAERIRATGVQAVQINTGKGCHLDAHMVGQALDRLAMPQGGAMMIENVGNLVCPAAFDLGEAHKVVILSVTEGEDKPIKYPDMFRAASLMLLNKCDLLPYLTFDVETAIGFARRVNPTLRVIRTSATSGEGLAEWQAWINEGVAAARAQRDNNVAALRKRVAQLEQQLGGERGGT